MKYCADKRCYWGSMGILFIYMLLLSHFFNISGWRFSIGPLLLDIFSALFFLYNIAIPFKQSQTYRNKRFYTLSLFLIFWPFLTILIKQIYTNDPINSEVQQTFMMCLAFSSFFYLKRMNKTERECLLLLLIFALLTLCIQWWQLLNLEDRYFGFNEDGGSGNRNGISRLYVGSPLITMAVLYFSWQELMYAKKIYKIIYTFFVVALVISVYLTLTRQYMVSVACILLLSIIFVRNKKARLWVLLFIILFVLAFFYYYDVLFENIVDLSKTESFSTEIRRKALPFFVNEIFSDPVVCIFGHGHTEEMVRISNLKGYWAVDLGILGEIYHYGIVWGIAYFYVIFKIWKERGKLPPYIIMFFLSTLIHSPMVAAYVTGLNALLWSIYLYIVSLHLSNSNLKLVVSDKK